MYAARGLADGTVQQILIPSLLLATVSAFNSVVTGTATLSFIYYFITLPLERMFLPAGETFPDFIKCYLPALPSFKLIRMYVCR